MSDSITTQIDTTGPVSDTTRAAAASYLTRTGNADLLDMLGLTAAPVALHTCPVCGNRRESDGRPCRRRTCAAGSQRRLGGAS